MTQLTPIKAKKPDKARVTVLVGCSADGFQFKPLVIGKSHQPRCFRGTDMSTLDCVYMQQDSAWMSGEIMVEYFQQVVIPTVEERYPDQEVIIIMFILVDSYTLFTAHNKYN